MNKLSRKELLLIGVVVIFAFIVLITYFIFGSIKPSEQRPDGSSLPVSSGGVIPEPSIQTSPTPFPVIDQAKVDALIAQLPYDGEYMYLDFNEEENVFMYAYRKDAVQPAENELVQFLRQHGFLGRNILNDYGVQEYFY